MKIVKILPDSSASKNYCANGVLRLVGINTASDVDGDVLMKSDGYNAVFKTTKKNCRQFAEAVVYCQNICKWESNISCI